MISQVNSSLAGVSYTQGLKKDETLKPNAHLSRTDDGRSKIQQLKQTIEAGEYTIDLSVLAKKMANELL
jgi:anti-sigma28 factor (negative regulator of flagellin synthesis)